MMLLRTVLRSSGVRALQRVVPSQGLHVSSETFAGWSTGSQKLGAVQNLSPRALQIGTASAAVLAGLAAAAASSGSAPISYAAAPDKKAPATALDPSGWTSFELMEKLPLTHNTMIYRFKLPEKDMVLGLPVASCLVTRYATGEKSEDGKPKFVIRPYTPTSEPNAKGCVDLVVKEYPNGKMSKHIASLKIGDKLDFKGPIPKLPYTANMKRQIGMIAGGTGITPMLQVLDAVVSNPEDQTQVSLVFANVTPEDILLKPKLDELAASAPNFKVYYVVDKPTPAWKGGAGFLTKDMLAKALPPPSPDTLILVCGPPGFMAHVSGDKAKDKSQGQLAGLLKELGHSAEQVFKF